MNTAFWWNARPNYGDALTPLLLERFAGMTVEWAPVEHAQIVAVGSILDLLPPGWPGLIVGAGRLHEYSTVHLDHARILALRGALSAKGVRGDFVLGDPGLLCAEIVQVPDVKEYDLTVVPHWSDTGTLAGQFAKWDPHIVDPTDPPEKVIAEIASSKKIVASSLHGIVIADAFRIPRRCEPFPNIDHRYEGGTFKYDDYASALGEKSMVFGELHEPNPRRVDRAQSELFDVFQLLAGMT